MNILCVISARGGSKGFRNKNVKKINGKPLIAWTILQAKKSNLFEEVFVSTDSRKIKLIAERYGAVVPFVRKKNLSNDNASKFLVWKDALKRIEEIKKKKYNLFLDLDCTNPIRSIKDIKEIVKILRNKKKINGIITITKSRKNPYFNMVKKKKGFLQLVNKSKNHFHSRQRAPIVYDIVASMYCFKTSYIRTANNLLDGKIIGYEVSQDKSYDIDNKIDFKIIEMIQKKINNNVK